MTPSNDDPAQVALVALLDALASVLIHLEITPARLAQIARTSFVKVGSSQARMRTSGRPHLAKIAAPNRTYSSRSKEDRFCWFRRR